MHNFLEIITKADNIPIVAMLLIVGFMTVFMLREGSRNDALIQRGEADKVYDRMNRWVWGEKDEEEDD